MSSSLPSARAPRRGLAVVAATALVGVPLLTGSAAGATDSGTASDAVASQPTVITFSGGCALLGIGGRSAPDVSEARVAAGSSLRFANQLGQQATIWLDDESNATVAAGGEADVTFHQAGSIAVSMQISCLLGTPVGTVAVEVVPAAPHPPSPQPPTSPPAAGGPPGDGGTPEESAGAGAGDGADAPRSEAPGSGSGAPGDGGSETPGGPDAHPPAGAEGSSGGGQLDSPADGPMSEPGTPDSEPATDPASDSEGGVGLGGTVTVNPPKVDQSSEVAPVSRSRSDDGIVGLLALVATVCLVGASVGAVRVLASRRVSAAKWA